MLFYCVSAMITVNNNVFCIQYFFSSNFKQSSLIKNNLDESHLLTFKYQIHIVGNIRITFWHVNEKCYIFVNVKSLLEFFAFLGVLFYWFNSMSFIEILISDLKSYFLLLFYNFIYNIFLRKCSIILYFFIFQKFAYFHFNSFTVTLQFWTI